MDRKFYSQREGLSPHPHGLPLADVVELFLRLHNQMLQDGYFTEALGYECVDSGFVAGTLRDVELDILLTIRKRNLWPPAAKGPAYREDDLFDIIEYLFTLVSKPTDGYHHTWNDCGMHWSTFDKTAGEKEYVEKVNGVLRLYERRFSLSPTGEVLMVPEIGLDRIFKAKPLTKDQKIIQRIDAAVLKFRRHASNNDDRRHAVRDLADVLELLRPKMEAVISDKDEGALFNIANNFAIRHYNEKQKNQYDPAWLSWMFYFYLSTIHVILHRIAKQPNGKATR